LTSITPATRGQVAPDRHVPAEVTCSRVEPLMGRIGVTRIADVTQLDCTGICVHQVIRPNARSLSVSQGKGLRAVDSRVSAMMESLEVWHAEEVVAAVPGRSAAQLASRLSYDVMALHLVRMSLLTRQVLLDWLPAETLPGREPTFVPHRAVSLDLRVDDRWSLPLFAPTSDGLASGNTASEAELHALLEVVEREAVARWRARGSVAPLPQATAHGIGEQSAALLDRLEAAGLSWRAWDCTGPADLPCYLVTVSSEFFLRQTAGGSGCHPEPDVALRTAILEAVQARVAAIAGSRDDLRLQWLEWRPPPAGTAPRPRRPLAAASGGPAPSVADESRTRERVSDVAERIRRQAGHDPIVVDLTSSMRVPVVKVVAPGLRRPG